MQCISINNYNIPLRHHSSFVANTNYIYIYIHTRVNVKLKIYLNSHMTGGDKYFKITN